MAIDLDDLFSYKTFKLVIVRDRRLGFLYYFCVLAIAAYIIYNIVKDQLYLQKDPISGGTVNVRLLRPDSWQTSYSYCSGETSCTYLAPEEISPTMQHSSLFLTTMASVREREPAGSSCISSDPKFTNMAMCVAKFKDATPANSRFVTGIEDYQIRIEHVVKSNVNTHAYSNRDLKGALKMPGNKEFLGIKFAELKNMMVFLPSNTTESEKQTELDALQNQKDLLILRKPDQTGDIMTVRTLLNAAGIKDLNEISAVSGAGQTLRQSGLSIIVFIDYTNRLSNALELKYSYVVSAVLGVEQKIDFLSKPVLGAASTDSDLYTKTGIQISFVQTGRLGYFDFMALLRNIVASLALLSVSQLVVEMLMLYVLPNRNLYADYKFQKTEDFSDIRDNLEKDAPKEFVA